MSEELTLRYIPLAQVARWNRNPKKHDLGAILESIYRHGFKDPPKFEPLLNDGAGGIVEGNGRDEALQFAQQQQRTPPRGIRVGDDGDWLIPILFGVDASSQAAAEAYGLDHNSLTLAGGEFTAEEIARLWTADYLTILTELSDAGELPVSVDGDDLDALFTAADTEAGEGGESDGSLLALTEVAIGEPRHTVTKGEVWHVGKHLLICADVFTDWVLWTGYLTGDMIFAPFPGPFIPLTLKADRHTICMVQPDPYIAGHILDRYEERHGSGTIIKD